MLGNWDVRIDPWTVEYGAETPGVSMPDDGSEGQADVDVELPAGAWRELRPATGRPASVVFFVDGVRRIDARLVVTKGASVVHGALGSYGVGAVRAGEGRAQFAHTEVGRAVIFGSGEHPGSGIDLGQSLGYLPRSTADADPDAPLRALHAEMRGREAELAARLAADRSLVIADGPLNIGPPPAGCVVGLVKRLFRTYLPPDGLAVVRELSPRARTPVFLIGGEGRFARYSWFARLGTPLKMESAFTGIVRLEVPEAIGAPEAIRLADAITGWLPSFVPPRARDPRAPQNLVPIGALEEHLRHRLGDARLIRRRLATLLAQRTPAATDESGRWRPSA
jgi:hypothetical protein